MEHQPPAATETVTPPPNVNAYSFVTFLFHDRAELCVNPRFFKLAFDAPPSEILCCLAVAGQLKCIEFNQDAAVFVPAIDFDSIPTEHSTPTGEFRRYSLARTVHVAGHA